jgi:hypothetical protein
MCSLILAHCCGGANIYIVKKVNAGLEFLKFSCRYFLSILISGSAELDKTIREMFTKRVTFERKQRYHPEHYDSMTLWYNCLKPT